MSSKSFLDFNLIFTHIYVIMFFGVLFISKVFLLYYDLDAVVIFQFLHKSWALIEMFLF
ncbi:MAG: hypothetical protein KAG96_00895 [Ichthyobacteriaceae bacterium]|nr:hypothetical protein [Ichthyobacteriaceae bacterium]